jgi:hypothetical protein
MTVSFVLINFFEKNVTRKLRRKIDSAASHGCNGKYMKYGSFPWPPAMAACDPKGLAIVLHNKGMD